MTKAILAIWIPLLCAAGAELEGSKQTFEMIQTERVLFAPAGVIRVEGSYGYLTVEGWDEPEVEITVIKSTGGFYKTSRREPEEERLKKVRVVTQRRSDKELVISTTPAVRKSVFFLPRTFLPSPRHGMTPDYRIRVPRNSKLDVRQDNGYVWVSDVMGDIEVRSHRGDMIVLLPDAGSYSIDARTGLGSVSSDFDGNGHRYLAGSHWVQKGTASSRRIYLRMGSGCITVKKSSSDDAARSGV